MNVELDVTEVKEVKADERGRVNLGTEYADKRLKVAIVEVDADE